MNYQEKDDVFHLESSFFLLFPDDRSRAKILKFLAQVTAVKIHVKGIFMYFTCHNERYFVLPSDTICIFEF